MQGRIRWWAIVAVGGAGSAMAEVVWLHELDRILGATALAATAAAAALFVSMALGSLAAERVARRESADGAENARGAAVLLQLGAGLWAALAPWLAPLLIRVTDLAAASDGAVSLSIALHYVIAFVALLPPGVAAGALVPLLSRFVVEERPGRSVARLWAWDAVGAAAGAGLTGVLLLGWLGAEASLWLESALHVAAASLLSRARLPSAAASDARRSSTDGPRHESRRGAPRTRLALDPALVALALAVAGVAGIGWQSLWTRQLVLTLPGGIAWPATLVAAWVLATAGGAALYSRARWLHRRPGSALAWSLLLGAGGSWVGVALGGWVGALMASARPISPWVAEPLIAALVALPGGLPLGFALPSAVELLAPGDANTGAVTGRALAFDLSGSILGSLLVPLVLVPELGLGRAILLLGGVQLVVGAIVAGRLDRRVEPSASRGVTLATVFFVLLAFGAAARTDLSPLPSRDGAEPLEIVRVDWGPAAVAAVVSNRAKQRTLFVDRHHGMGGQKGVFIERREGHIPLLLHGRAKTVAVVGIGTGDTLGAVARHQLRRIDAAESLASVLRMLDLFGDTNRRIWRDDRVNIVHTDGATMLRRSGRRYDVVLTDLVHPWRSGASTLYSADYLRSVRDHLAPGGVFCFWLPLHELSIEDISIVAATFSSVFDHELALLGHLGRRQPIMALVGSDRPASDLLSRRRLWALLGARPPEWAEETDLESPEDLQSLFLGGDGWVRELGRDAPITTWNRPLLAYHSVRTWWRGTEGLGERTLGRLLERRESIDALLPEDDNAIRRQEAVGLLLRAELAEARGELREAVRGYEEAARRDPTFHLPVLALRLLRHRLEDSSR